jgi:hypothetical protein
MDWDEALSCNSRESDSRQITCLTAAFLKKAKTPLVQGHHFFSSNDGQLFFFPLITGSSLILCTQN